jgi:hypothetical protein
MAGAEDYYTDSMKKLVGLQRRAGGRNSEEKVEPPAERVTIEDQLAKAIEDLRGVAVVSGLRNITQPPAPQQAPQPQASQHDLGPVLQAMVDGNYGMARTILEKQLEGRNDSERSDIVGQVVTSLLQHTLEKEEPAPRNDSEITNMVVKSLLDHTLESKSTPVEKPSVAEQFREWLGVLGVDSIGGIRGLLRDFLGIRENPQPQPASSVVVKLGDSGELPLQDYITLRRFEAEERRKDEQLGLQREAISTFRQHFPTVVSAFHKAAEGLASGRSSRARAPQRKERLYQGNCSQCGKTLYFPAGSSEVVCPEDQGGCGAVNIVGEEKGQ